jgi:7-cyano-7-deazaguanine reductase
MDKKTDLKALSQSAAANRGSYNFDEPDPAVLETFPNPAADRALNAQGAGLTIDIEAPEFTSLCPITGQPDFATIKVSYEPDALCVESKSFKLYLLGYRNHGSFHEECVTTICNHLVNALNPKWLKVTGEFTPRGGIPFWPTAEYRREK